MDREKINLIAEVEIALVLKVREEWKGKLGNIRINKEEVTEGLEYLYSKINKPLPEIMWVCSPSAMNQAALRYYDTGNIFNADIRNAVDGSWEYMVDRSVRQWTWQYIWLPIALDSYPRFRLDPRIMGGEGSICDYDRNAWVDFVQRLGYQFGNSGEVVEKIFKLQSVYDYTAFENVVIVCEHPKYPPKRNGEGRLHSDGSAAIEWEDGYKLWYLNGVRVPQYLAETPAGKLDLDWYLQEQNADVRAQFIWKYGIERMSGMGKVIDSYKNYSEINEYWKKSEYELIDMAPIHENMEKALYLKMKNQTVDGVYHLEGVSNGCETIYDAIKCRWNGLDPSQYVTINIK